MIPYPRIDPVAFQIGPLKVHWYGLMYLVSFAAGWWLGRRRARDPWRRWSGAQVDDLLFYVALGVVLGGRLGYVLFYDLGQALRDPAFILQLWRGGMSFHGGLIGVIVAMVWFARKQGKAFFEVADFVAPLVPPGLFAGRIGNFINGNLWGRETDLPWAMSFPDPRAGGLPRHPSQLYEALLEGVLLFIVLWLYSRSPRPARAVCGLFLLGYGVIRFGVEFVRLPDAHIGYLAFDWLTMGQALSLPMIVAGAALIGWAYRGGEAEATATTPAMPEGAASPRRGKRKRK